MIDQVDTDITDLGTYLGKIARRLIKEGDSLQALAGIWYEKGNDNIVRTFGGDIASLGELLLALRNRLCQKCMMQEVKIILNFGSSNSPAEEKKTDQD